MRRFSQRYAGGSRFGSVDSKNFLKLRSASVVLEGPPSDVVAILTTITDTAFAPHSELNSWIATGACIGLVFARYSFLPMCTAGYLRFGPMELKNYVL